METATITWHGWGKLKVSSPSGSADLTISMNAIGCRLILNIPNGLNDRIIVSADNYVVEYKLSESTAAVAAHV